jgi:hypothetical protein
MSLENNEWKSKILFRDQRQMLHNLSNEILINEESQVWWYMSVIPATQQAEIWPACAKKLVRSHINKQTRCGDVYL